MSNRREILHIVPWACYGGTEYSVLNLCRAQPQNNHFVLFLSNGPITKIFSENGIENFVLDSFSFPRAKEKEFFQAIEKSEVLHIHDLEYRPEVHKFVKQYNKPYLMSLQGRAILPKLNCPIVCSSKTLIQEQRAENECYLINNGVDI